VFTIIIVTEVGLGIYNFSWDSNVFNKITSVRYLLPKLSFLYLDREMVPEEGGKEGKGERSMTIKTD